MNVSRAQLHNQSSFGASVFPCGYLADASVSHLQSRIPPASPLYTVPLGASGLEHKGEHVHVGKGIKKDGSYFPIEVSISKGSYDSVFYVVVVTDKTEMEQKEHQLQESKDCWKYALSGSDVGIWDWKIKTGVLTLSDQWKEMLG